ncbi:hypothetical protein, partial [Pseudomonas sp. GP01-A4]|uniref:hypothetical protein n=1 Tax=Pseudomonas sp. GP01-A4 TaxID=2070571 RepID=UPI001304A632
LVEFADAFSLDFRGSEVVPCELDRLFRLLDSILGLIHSFHRRTGGDVTGDLDRLLRRDLCLPGLLKALPRLLDTLSRGSDRVPT